MRCVLLVRYSILETGMLGCKRNWACYLYFILSMGSRCVEPRSGSKQPRLDCGFSDIHFLSHFLERTSSRHSCLKRLTQVDVKSPNCAVDVRAPLPLIADLLGIEARILRLQMSDVVFRFAGKTEAQFGMVATFTKKHKGRVNRDARQPGV